MRKSLIRTTALAATAFAAFSLTACGSGGGEKSDDASGSKSSTSASKGKDSGSDISTESGGSDKNSANGIGTKSGGGVEQTCGANDVSWHVSSKTQAGGYYQIEVQALDGKTCWLPAELPYAAFKPNGSAPEMVAKPAEQSVGEAIKLSGDKSAYAGVSPKSVNEEGGTYSQELRHKISANDKTDTSRGTIGKVAVIKPVVTNWHLDPQDAVPGIY